MGMLMATVQTVMSVAATNVTTVTIPMVAPIVARDGETVTVRIVAIGTTTVTSTVRVVATMEKAMTARTVHPDLTVAILKVFSRKKQLQVRRQGHRRLPMYPPMRRKVLSGSTNTSPMLASAPVAMPTSLSKLVV